MKCKLSKLFFLALIGAISVKGYSQTEEGRKKIVQDYDLNAINKLAKELDSKFKLNYNKALEVAKQKNLPIGGIDPDGGLFSLKGVDEQTGDLTYYKAYNNTPTKSSVQTARAQHLYNGGSLGINIQGQLMTLGIWDGGQPQASHQNLGVTRVTNKDGQTTIPGLSASELQEGISHATHVSGTMIGNGTAVSNARGLAFQGFLWSNTWTNDISEMATQAGLSLLVSNHSYGTRNDSFVSNPGVFGRYTVESQQVDQVTSEAPNYQPVYAAGNDRNRQFSGVYLNSARNGYDLLTHDAVSKNGVVVAAIEGFTSYVNASSAIMSTFSQWGPTDDFRIKPDISSKGVDVYSSDMPSSGSVNHYDYLDGTSMAAPSVTAVFALWQQYFKELHTFEGIENMRAASLKALMAHTASEAGSYRERGSALDIVTSEGPDPRFGWGVINAEGGAKVMQDAFAGASTAVFKELQLNNGQDYFLDVIVDGTQKLTATIAWTDLPGAVVSGTDSNVPVLVNDLDMRIYGPNDTSFINPVGLPYVLNKSWLGSNLYAIKADNDVDPIEKILYYSDFDGLAEAGKYRIKVSHKGNLTGGNQKFTLIVSGGVLSFEEPNVSSEQFKFESLKVYPNPVTDILNLSADFNTIENANVTIYDMLGKKVYQNDSLFNFSGDASVNVSDFSAGIYLVEIMKDGKIDTRKIIKK